MTQPDPKSPGAANSSRPFTNYEGLARWPETWLPTLDPEAYPAVAVLDGPASATPIDFDNPIASQRLVGLPEDILDLSAYRAAGWPAAPPRSFVRQAVAERLASACAVLPTGFGLAVFDAWRSPGTIRALWDHYYGPGSTLAPGYVSDPDHPTLIPPHQTGGAVDLTLSWQGQAINLGTAFDDFSPDAAADAYERPNAPPQVTALRRLLHWAMTAHDFVGLESEWWHFSFGDQAWGASQGRATLFGPTDPVGPKPTRTASSPEVLRGWRSTHPDWTYGDRHLSRSYTFTNFESAIEFMSRCAFYCEALDHHPRWTNTYRTVEVDLWTHDRDGITGYDLRLAELFDAEFRRMP